MSNLEDLLPTNSSFPEPLGMATDPFRKQVMEQLPPTMKAARFNLVGSSKGGCNG